MLEAPSAATGSAPTHGRDVLSHHLRRPHRPAGRLLSSFIGSTIGAAIGIVSAYFGGRIDMAVQGVMNDPVVSDHRAGAGGGRHRQNVVGGVDVNLIVAIAPMVPDLPGRALVGAGDPRDGYIDAARAAGFSHSHRLSPYRPNVAAPYLIMLTALMAQAICWKRRCRSAWA